MTNPRRFSPRILSAWLTSLICLAALAVSLWTAETASTETQQATGLVFHDENGNGQYDAVEETLSDVSVSNGREVVQTDEQGRYELTVDDNTTLFVVKPRGWKPPLDGQMLPQFHYIHKPDGSPQLKYQGVKPTGPLPESVNFPLYPQKEPEEFEVVLFGDPQPRNQEEIDYMAHDIVTQLIGSEAGFGVSLGDVMFDDLRYYESLNKIVSQIGVPWYNVVGNHDIDYQAPSTEQATGAFERVYGPTYYSFNYGPAHFITLNDVHWINDGEERKYYTGLGQEQLEFIENDLQHVPDEKLVVLMMHIPLVDSSAWKNEDERQQLYRLLEDRSHCISISGHTHTHEHRMIGEDDGWKGEKPHHHLINGTICGSWWKGPPGETGIPLTTMRDGTPNGYSVMTIDGNQYSFRYRAARRPRNYQMHIFTPDGIPAAELPDTEVVANVFNGWPNARVEMKIGRNGSWQPMQLSPRPDPYYVQQKELESKLESFPWRELNDPRTCSHIWTATLPDDLREGVHTLFIRAENPDGEQMSGRRIIRVE